jgi:hypothetical protein
MSDNHSDHGKDDGHKKTGHDDGHGKASRSEPPKPPQTKGKGDVMGSVFKAFKGLFEFDLNSLISLADPEIRKIAEDLADRLSRTLPPDSVLRHEFTERLIGHLKSRIETVSEQHGEWVGQAGEKVSDFLDMFTSAFYKRDRGHGGAPAQPASKKQDAGVTDLDREFLKWAQEAMAKCAPAEAETLRAEIIKIAETRESLKKLIAEGLPKPKDKHHDEGHGAPSAPPKIRLRDQVGDWLDTNLQPVNEDLARRVAIAQLEKSRLAREREAKKGWLSRLLSIPLTIVKAIFFPK